MRVCPQCGARYEDDAAFCPMDGSPLGELPSPSVPTPGPAPTFAPPPRVASATSSSVLRWQPAADSPEPKPEPKPEPEPEPGPESEPEESLLGVILGDRYRVDERIGAGGMGLVYKATHVLIGRKLAIKILRRRYARQPEIAQRFAQEARVASSVKHPNVVDIIDFGTTPQGSPYCVMEFLPGCSLAREIAQTGPLEPTRAIGVAIHVARGLAAAHQAGVIHRDLKPDNVFLVPADAQAPEQVKILDFGIARVTSRKTRLTAAGSIVGTPEYMSPEQARGDELDMRSDLYALGVLLFEALTGQVPLAGDSMVGTLTKQVFELPPPIREIDPKFAEYPSIEAALARLLAKNRDERPATALDAARLLQTAAANDLEPVEDRREQAALAGWTQSGPIPAAPEPDRPRRSTIMLGSGAITSAHEIVEADGPATGSFAAKLPAEAPVQKRPSVIVSDPPAGQSGSGQFRPARIHVTQVSHTPPPPTPAPVSRTPTPASTRPRLGKPPRKGVRRSHLPLILLGLGAAIFAALVTIGFVRWLQRREAKEATGMNPGSSVEHRDVGRGEAHDPDARRREVTNTLDFGAVETLARADERFSRSILHDADDTLQASFFELAHRPRPTDTMKPPWRKCGTLARPPIRRATHG